MADHEVHVLHVLLVVAAHHLCEDQIDGRGAEQAQEFQRRAQHWEDFTFPLAAEEDLPLTEKVRHVKSLAVELRIHRSLRIPKLIVSVERVGVRVAEDDVHIQRVRHFAGRTCEAEGDRCSTVNHERDLVIEERVQRADDAFGVGHAAIFLRCGRSHCVTIFGPTPRT